MARRRGGVAACFRQPDAIYALARRQANRLVSSPPAPHPRLGMMFVFIRYVRLLQVFAPLRILSLTPDLDCSCSILLVE